jgi:UDP-glucuronate 4-epimerase
MKLLVTGCAGFIGWKVSEKLLNKGHEVVGVDNLNDYYDVKLKFYRLELLKKYKNFKFYKVDIENYQSLMEIFQENKFDAVINEAARAGVRYSLENPFIYITTNVYGTLNLLELCRKYNVPKFVLASTSSLYAGQPMPFKEDLPVNTPISPYAASKKSAEVIAYTYNYHYGIDVSVVRYFTVYGPAGRPDMSIFRFIKWIMEDRPIEVFGDGTQSRDFTYVDDIAEGTILALKPVGYEIINLGGNNPHELTEIIKLNRKVHWERSEIGEQGVS